MLRQLRSKKTMKFTMVFVAAAFVIGYALLSIDFGGPNPMATNIAAVVNGFDVPYEYYSARVSQLAEAERLRYQRDDLRTSDYERIESDVWEGIITEVLLRQEAERLGIQAADEEIIANLESSPPPEVRQYFLDDEGQFDNAAYQQALNNPSFPWVQFEESLRQQLPVQKLREMVIARATVSESEVRREFARRTLRNTVQYVGVPYRSIESDDAEASEEALRAHYDAHPERFQSRANVVLEVLQISKEPSLADEQELQQDAVEMIEELEQGTTKDFASLAEIYSDDPSSSRGGDLGWVTRGTLPAAVDSIAWGLAPGERSAPIMTEQGIYVVQVDSSKVDENTEQTLKVRQVFLRLQTSPETLDSLRSLALEVSDAAKDNFEAASRRYDLTMQRLDPVEENGLVPGFGFSRRLRDWAFDAKPGDVEGPFGSDDAILVARLVEKNEPGPLPFKEAKARIQSDLQQENRKVAARKRIQSVHSKVAGGMSLTEAAEAEGLEITEPAPFNYYEAVAGIGGSNEFTAVASELEVGQTSGVVETPSGAYLIHLVERDPFDEEQYKSTRATHYQSLYTREASQIYEAWLKELREGAEVVDQRGPRV